MKQEPLNEIAAWLEEARGGLPTGHKDTRYIVCVAPALLERMREAFPFEPGDYRTKGGQAKTDLSIMVEIPASLKGRESDG